MRERNEKRIQNLYGYFQLSLFLNKDTHTHTHTHTHTLICLDIQADTISYMLDYFHSFVYTDPCQCLHKITYGYIHSGLHTQTHSLTITIYIHQILTNFSMLHVNLILLLLQDSLCKEIKILTVI